MFDLNAGSPGSRPERSNTGTKQLLLLLPDTCGSGMVVYSVAISMHVVVLCIRVNKVVVSIGAYVEEIGRDVYSSDRYKEECGSD